MDAIVGREIGGGRVEERADLPEENEGVPTVGYQVL